MVAARSTLSAYQPEMSIRVRDRSFLNRLLAILMQAEYLEEFRPSGQRRPPASGFPLAGPAVTVLLAFALLAPAPALAQWASRRVEVENLRVGFDTSMSSL